MHDHMKMINMNQSIIINMHDQQSITINEHEENQLQISKELLAKLGPIK